MVVRNRSVEDRNTKDRAQLHREYLCPHTGLRYRASSGPAETSLRVSSLGSADILLPVHKLTGASPLSYWDHKNQIPTFARICLISQGSQETFSYSGHLSKPAHLIGRVHELDPGEESPQLASAHPGAGFPQCYHLALHQGPPQAELADQQGFGAWPCGPGNIKGIFPEVVNAN